MGEKVDHLALALGEEEAVAGAYGMWHMQNKVIVPRHGTWCRRPKCRAKRSGAVQSDARSARPTWQLCCVTIKGATATYIAPCSMALQKRINLVK
jgi:hypothetical protein